MSDLLTMRELARRTGVATSALLFYEALGLIRAEGRRPCFLAWLVVASVDAGLMWVMIVVAVLRWIW